MSSTTTDKPNLTQTAGNILSLVSFISNAFFLGNTSHISPLQLCEYESFNIFAFVFATKGMEVSNRKRKRRKEREKRTGVQLFV